MLKKFFNKGIGLLLLVILSIGISFHTTQIGKDALIKLVPNAQDVINQIAPLEIKNGEVIEPINSYKEVYFKFFDDENIEGFKIVLDTKDDTLDLNKIKDDVPSMHLAKKKLYFVQKDKISQTDLNEISLRLEPKDYQEEMKQGISLYGNIFGIIIFVLSLLYYFLFACIMAVISFLMTIGQEIKPNFAARLRVSSLAIFIATIANALLNLIGSAVGDKIYTLVIVLLVLIFIRFVPIWKTEE